MVARRTFSCFAAECTDYADATSVPYRTMAVLQAFLFAGHFQMHSFGAKINAVLFSGALAKAIAAPTEGNGVYCAV